MKAIIEISCENPEIIKKAIEVEKDTEFLAKIRTENKKIIIEITATKLSMLQAGINSYLRALKALPIKVD